MTTRNQGRSVAGTASDPTLLSAPLEIDGKTYHLVYDFNAIARAEKIGECNLLHGIFAVLGYTVTAIQLRGLLFAALMKLQPRTTLEAAGALLRIDTIPDIRDALMKAYDLSLPEGKKILAAEAKRNAAEKSPPDPS